MNVQHPVVRYHHAQIRARDREVLQEASMITMVQDGMVLETVGVGPKVPPEVYLGVGAILEA